MVIIFHLLLIDTDFLHQKYQIASVCCAQCFPRHACPLYGAVLMQLHEHSGSAPALAAHGQNGQPLRMQKHAPVACTAKNGEIAEKWHKKPAFTVPVWGWFCRDYWACNAPITLLRHMLAKISRKIVVHRFS
ncbi:hypothetical protein AAA169_19875 [Escherichia coli]|nr:hypothetical protein [Escherichia coli]